MARLCGCVRCAGWVPQGEERAHSLTGLPAVVFQHELDHLDGVLMCDRAVRAEEIEELKKQGKVRAHTRTLLCTCNQRMVLSHGTRPVPWRGTSKSPFAQRPDRDPWRVVGSCCTCAGL